MFISNLIEKKTAESKIMKQNFASFFPLYKIKFNTKSKVLDLWKMLES